MTTGAPVIVFPGPRHPDRRHTILTDTSSVNTTLEPNIRLIDALEAVADRHGASSAQFELMGGTLDRISYCFPACGAGENPISYSETHESDVPAQLLTASVTFGYRHGERFMHCHAAWIDASGALRAGHLWLESRLGPVPVYAVLHTLSGIDMISDDDPETRMPAFTPTASSPAVETDGDRARAVIGRILPGEDIVEAAEEICRAHGFSRALVRAGVGSLVGGCLRRADSDKLVDGPATEIVTIQGSMASDANGAVHGDLSAILVDLRGDVHAGLLIRGRNPVAVTFELLVIEDREAHE
ncbi:PCC domain-containing protein [Rhodococcoides yunnanense]|uniref:PCC domain-containing protein n=1 Tax=Rhodococcoides yunnanense TaxID=278209 RepID=UPI000A74F24A|nr:DUF296 domain-containing protein [Rhodococcus yunnanensis]